MPAASPTTAAPRVFTVPQDGVIATRPATTPEAAPNVVGLPSRICSTVIQPSMPRQPATSVFRKTAAAIPLAARAEPALNPNQPNHSRPTAEQHERQVVRAHGVLLETDAGAEHQRQRQRRHAGDDFDDQAARVVQRPKLEQPTARSPHPVGHHRIHGDRPQRDEHHPGRELGAVRDRTADQCGGDDREAQLEGGEQQFGNRSARGVRVDAEHPDVLEAADQSAGAVLGERDGVADQQPGHGHQRDRDEAHHDHVEHAGGADHAAVEDGESWRHQQDERGAGEQPCGGGRIDRVQFGLPPGSEKSICFAFRRSYRTLTAAATPDQLDLMKF